jgi:hypothetical protein
MRLKQLAVAFALAGAAVAAAGLVAAPADAAPKKKTTERVYYNRDRTVVVSRDENGRTRTRVIVQKRSYLDPGTEPLPSEQNAYDYAEYPGQRADSVLNHTIFGSDMTALPGPFTLPSSHNPWLQP